MFYYLNTRCCKCYTMYIIIIIHSTYVEGCNSAKHKHNLTDGHVHTWYHKHVEEMESHNYKLHSYQDTKSHITTKQYFIRLYSLVVFSGIILSGINCMYKIIKMFYVRNIYCFAITN